VSTWLVEKMSGILEARTDRRGFLSRSAMVGSAMAVAPMRFVLEPGTAYGTICNCNGSLCSCGDLCCDGYTEFCCTIYGENRCPSGTMVAGWWKVDGSSFCLKDGRPQARYYCDCNAVCGGCAPDASGFCSGACFGCGCGCAKGNCSHRKACCTKFRYGQCNQDVPHLGPIACRVITCTPPWVWEDSCTTAVATDYATAFHDAPCLHESDPGTPEFVPFEEDMEMMIVQRPDNSGRNYLLYPSGLLIECTGNVTSLLNGGIQQMGKLTPTVFNRLVVVNEQVRGQLGLSKTLVPRM
jgi:hypothetical protein